MPKMNLRRIFFKLMNSSVFVKTMENVRNHRVIKLVTSDQRRKRLASEPNYHSHTKFSEHLKGIKMKKIVIEMTKPLYLCMSILDISKILMYEFWYDYIKSKDGDKAKPYYMDTDIRKNIFACLFSIHNTISLHLDEAHLDAVRELVLLRGFRPAHQQVELVRAMRYVRQGLTDLLHAYAKDLIQS